MTLPKEQRGVGPDVTPLNRSTNQTWHSFCMSKRGDETKQRKEKGGEETKTMKKKTNKIRRKQANKKKADLERKKERKKRTGGKQSKQANARNAEASDAERHVTSTFDSDGSSTPQPRSGP